MPIHRWRARAALAVSMAVRWASRTPTLIVWSGVGISVMVMAVAVALLYEGRLLVLARASDNQRNIVDVLERDLELNFQLYEASLDAVVTLLARPDVDALPPGLRRELIFERAGAARHVGSLVVLDENGNIVIDAASELPRNFNFSDRDYFKVHRDDPHAGLFVSGFIHSRLRDNAPTMVLSRRITRPNGSFGGVVSLAVDIEYFRTLFNHIEVGQQGVILLLGKDGAILMRKPYDPSVIGLTMAQTGRYEALPPGRDDRRIVPIRFLGRDSMMSRRLLSNVPLTLIVVMSSEEILAPWHKRVIEFGGLFLLLNAGFVGASMLLAVQLRRRLRAERELRLLARTDGLTGLSNRRSLDKILANEWRRMRRSGRAMSVAFVDIDWFKRYNDTHGHQAGDAALAAVAGEIGAALERPSDAAGRYGGEEFIAVMPDTDALGAQRVAEGIRLAVERLDLEHKASDFGHVTVSVGVASCSPQGKESVDVLVKAADDALYRAKETGRNRVVVASEADHRPSR
ncbi:sensor domain-containing diguanylate cyclase [Pandoraea apista]|uniref:sensor domain-containing diguanylate cyclase n=1 Tax=Pandoraea apista TaxID=93218 RepID=UPI00069B32AB|nr:sensor domain-containing diguanylate cyclase [Pandoraea apista]OXS96395.1 GGDEF domain-containing protein [Pandoraea apista]